MRSQDHQSRVFNELCALILNILQSPHLPNPISNPSSAMAPLLSSSRRQMNTMAQISPTGFASLLLGISLALMLCGSVTFVIGFILLPWILGLMMVFYLVGIASNLSFLGRAFLCPTETPAPSSQKEMHAWKNFW